MLTCCASIVCCRLEVNVPQFVAADGQNESSDARWRIASPAGGSFTHQAPPSAAARAHSSSLIRPLIAHHHHLFHGRGRRAAAPTPSVSPPPHPEPINRSPPRMFPSEWAEWRGGELLKQLDNTPLLLPPASPPPPSTPPPTLPPSLSVYLPPSLPVWFNLFGNIRIGMFSPASLQSEIGQGHWSLTM